ncbi:hypothetical protein SAMN05216277_106226 [Halolamina pelagica]|uniref:Uncharacterized protein n=1 Tax=Halolamina pelagica TaxID=699431 RepID=A0A1I5SP82_9EURY|nr:hypothetical protein SAMN05216277_106226 [Halolamina pelagica]
MAKSDPDSNDLRQDQPECVRASARGWRVGSQYVIVTIWSCVSVTVRCPPAEPGDTELPRLASDTVLRRTTGAESSSVADSGNPGRPQGESRCPLRITSERPYSLKGVGSYRARAERVRVSPGATAPATFAFHSMGVEYLTPSEYRRYVMRFHAECSHGHVVDDAAALERKILRGRRAADHPTLALGVGPRGTARRIGPTRGVIHLSNRRTATAPSSTRRGARSPAWRRSPR